MKRITYQEVAYLHRECAKMNIKVSVEITPEKEIRLNIMDPQFTEYLPALHFVQTYQAYQAARWAAYKPSVKTEVAS